jgi:hypothetical protein
MLVLPEIQIQTALKQGFAAVDADVALLDDIFANYPADMRTEVKKYLTDTTVEVLLNWPPAEVTLPVVAIVNAGDTEAPDRDVLGDVFEELEVANTDPDVTEYRGIAKNATYRMLVLTQKPRFSVYLSYLVTTMLVLNAPAFQEAGMHNVLLSEADLRFEAQVPAEWINSRVVTLTCLHYHTVAVTERLLTALRVSVTVEG